MSYQSTKVIELGSCAFRQWRAASGREHAGENSARCSKLHGYFLTAKFWFESKLLDDRNWVVDFGGLGPLKQLLQDQFDHKLVCAANDPLLPMFKTLHESGGCDLRVMDEVGIEKTAEWCYRAANKYVNEITNFRCWVSKTEVWEYNKNSAVYIPQSNNL